MPNNLNDFLKTLRLLDKKYVLEQLIKNSELVTQSTHPELVSSFKKICEEHGVQNFPRILSS
jgi:hypothetical protein